MVNDMNFVTENLNFGTWIWYSVEDRLLFSKSFSKIAGLSQNSFYDFRTFFDLIHCNELLLFMNNIKDMLNGGSPRWIKFRIVRPDGTAQEMNCFMESLITEYGQIFDISGVCFLNN